MPLSKELKGLLHYPEYWDRNASLWGDIVDWDIFFINKTPSCTASDAHTALSSELNNLSENFPAGSFQRKKALALRAAIKRKNDRITELWQQHSQVLGRMAVNNRISKEKFRSVAMQNAAEEYSIESKNVEEDTTSNPFLASPKRKMLEDAAFLEDALPFKQTAINENEFENENEENDSEGEVEDDQGGGEREDEQDDEMEEEKEKEGLKLVALTNAHRREIKAAYDRMPKAQMWKLSSGTIVEEELFKIGERLKFEHAVHSFILDADDKIVQNHFSEEDLQEIIESPRPSTPQLSFEVAEYLSKFSTKTKVVDVREEIFNTPDNRFGKEYARELHHDLDYITYALFTIIREIENGHLQDNNLESWYNCHVWHAIVDQGLGNLQGVAVVRGESTSISTALRKNSHRKLHDRRKVGRRGDWILRSVGNGDRNEYGVGEAAKVWIDRYGTKFLKEMQLKVPKTLKDMLVKLMEKVDQNRGACARIQTVGILHAGLVMMAVFMDCPGGFVCRVLHGEIMEVPDREEKIPTVLPILATILEIKAAVQETMKAMSTQVPTTAEAFQQISVINKSQGKKSKGMRRSIPECMTTPSKRQRKSLRQ